MKFRTIVRTAAIAATVTLFGAVIAPSAAQAAAGPPGEGQDATASAEIVTTEAPSTEAPAPEAPPTDAPAAEAPETPEAPEIPDAVTPVPESNAPLPTETPAPRDFAPPVEPLAGSDSLQAQRLGLIWASFDLSRVALIGGHAVGTVKGELSQIPAELNATTGKAYVVRGSFDGEGSTGIRADAAYQVTMLGSASEYWIYPRLFESGGHASATCTVYKGDPAAGGSHADPSPFNCHAEVTQDFPNGYAMFTVDLNRDAEAQGIIKTQGTVSLTSGHYEPNVPYHVDGSTTVGQNSSTRFDVVLREGDKPIRSNLAQTVFVYRIAEDGVERPFWVAGWSQNHRGPTKFTFEGKCSIYDEDPVKALGSIDTLKPATVSPYTCKKTSDRTIGYRGNYEATFTVASRDMTSVDLPLQQKALVERVCGKKPQNCGLSLATVTPTVGHGRTVSDVVYNTGAKDSTQSITTTGVETITNSGGFEIDVTIGSQSPIGPKYEATLKTHYERSVTNTTKTAQMVGMTIPPGMRGWIEGTPPMVHTEGDIIVRDGERYYRLTNVVADFPDADGHWGLKTVTESLADTGRTKVTLQGTVSTDDGPASSAALSLVRGEYSLPLTNIGPAAYTSTPGDSQVGVNDSTIWSTRHEVTDPAESGGAIAAGNFTYRIAEDGIPTDYWIAGAAKTWNVGGSPSSSCAVYVGNPNSGGIVAEDPPYRCLTSVTPAGDDGVVEAAFSVAPAMADGTTPPTDVPPVTPPVDVTPGSADETNGASVANTKLATTGTDAGRVTLAGGILLAGGVLLFWAAAWRRRVRRA